jgi:hypothetical protein
MLPPGAKLHIILPDGTIRTFPEIRKAIRQRSMKVRYFNQQDKSDPMYGAAIMDRAQLNELLDMGRKAGRHLSRHLKPIMDLKSQWESAKSSAALNIAA